jgi:23S rRNA (pseudouridine1915-N3)-methyltransferase
MEAMRISVLHISEAKQERWFRAEFDLYIRRLRTYATVELMRLRDESGMLTSAARQSGRTAPWLVLLDSRGKTLSSEQLAARIGEERDSGRQEIIFAIGPADGWSATARERADLLLSFGPMTYPHELARVMLAEQLYRAFTILAGHPYHCGH